jgi:hypothetical protein
MMEESLRRSQVGRSRLDYNTVKQRLTDQYGKSEFRRFKSVLQTTMKGVAARTEMLLESAYRGEDLLRGMSVASSSSLNSDDGEEVAGVDADMDADAQAATAETSEPTAAGPIQNLPTPDNSFLWRIVGAFGENYFVGRKHGSLFVSYSRQYKKADREPLLFVLDPITASEGPSSSSSYGQSHIRVFTDNSSTASTYLGKLYRDESGFLKIMPQDAFSSSSSSSSFSPGAESNGPYTWLALNDSGFGYGENLEHQSCLSLFFMGTSARLAVNLEKRFFLGGEGDGLNSDYLVAVSSKVSPNLTRFELLDPSIVPKLNIQIAHLEAELKAQHQVRAQWEQQMVEQQRRQQQEWEASLDRSSDKAKEKDQNVHELQQVLAHVEKEFRETTLERDDKIKSLRQQRRLLKHEVLTLRSQLKEAEVQAVDEIKMLQAERATLRNQLRYEHELEASRKKTEASLIPSTLIEEEDQQKPEQPQELLRQQQELQELQELQEQQQQRRRRRQVGQLEKKDPASPANRVAGLRRSIFHRGKSVHEKKGSAAALLNAKSEISLLKTQLSKSLNQNKILKKSLAAEQTCVQDLSLKMHDLLVQLEEAGNFDRQAPPLPPREA